MKEPVKYAPPKPEDETRPKPIVQKLVGDSFTITRAQNGFILHSDAHQPYHTGDKPHVFETAEKLAAFIAERF